MSAKSFALAALCFFYLACADGSRPEAETLSIAPPVGVTELRILTPSMLELTLVNTKANIRARPEQWDFVQRRQTNLPTTNQFVVTANGQPIPIAAVGFKRRVLYAPLAQRDLRIGNYLYLQLQTPISEGALVEVKNPDGQLWKNETQFVATNRAARYSPAIHVNQTAYVPHFSKTAIIGYYLGSLGELEIGATNFSLVNRSSGETVFEGALRPRPDTGFPDQPPPYQKVLEADFSAVTNTGDYQLHVPGLGFSLPFFIDEGGAAAVARTYALGLYHQRCGVANSLPFTRFVHAPCHTAPAFVPNRRNTIAAQFLARSSIDYTNNARHVAPQLKDFTTSLYPFVRQGQVDVSGGHHDAGDYSKYTINSAGLVHILVFAADALPGVGELDNLGLPESGDGISDILQEAKWEADFLARMQDDDGGFYFLVYPRSRAYENDVLPDRGDPQIVWPKNTAATAAAVAALAQAASSPAFKRAFPEAAAQYLERANRGWAFLESALTQHGPDGAYQKLTHYGDDFMHDDELAWAACELFLATGNDALHQRLLASFDPSDPETRRWGWWRLYESYGRAIRSYAFAAATGRIPRERLDATFLRACETEILAAGDDQLRWAQQSAYGTSFPTETKRFRGGGWYFSMDQAFDLAVASALEPITATNRRSEYLRAILENLNYEAGCNPVNVSYLTGLGWNRPTEIVHHYAMNDKRVLPPSGIPIGNVQSEFMWLDHYQEELAALSFPPDGADSGYYPMYDRWSDSFNVQTEFVIGNQARGLATAAFLMAQTVLTNQPWRAATAQIDIQLAPVPGGLPRYLISLRTTGLDTNHPRVVWEIGGQPPVIEPTFTLTPTRRGPVWIEAEAHWPDGRRVFAVTNILVR